MKFSDVIDNLNKLLRGQRKTRHKSELSNEELSEYAETGCGEGYQWWLRHQGIDIEEETSKSYYRHIAEYHKWMG